MYVAGLFPEYTSLASFYNNSIWSVFWFKLVVMSGTAIIVLLPLNLLKEINKLRFTSMLGVFGLVVLMIIILVELPSYLKYYWNNIYNENDPKTFFNLFNVSAGFGEDLNFFKATASLYYSFCAHVGAFPVYQKILKRTEERTEKIFLRSILLDIVVYLLIGVGGYFTQPVNTPAMIIERESLPGSLDIAMVIGRVLVIMLFLAKSPAAYSCLRMAIFELVWGTNEISDGR